MAQDELLDAGRRGDVPPDLLDRGVGTDEVLPDRAGDLGWDHSEPAELDAVAGDRSLADRLAVLQAWAAGNGAGRPGGGGSQADVTISGTSAFDELALVYNADGKDHGTGKAYPSTPGHFDDPNACAAY